MAGCALVVLAGGPEGAGEDVGLGVRDGHCARQDVLGGDGDAVELGVVLGPGEEAGGVEGHGGEEPLAAAVRVHGGHLRADAQHALGVAAEGPDGDGEVAADLEAALVHEGVDGGLGVEHQHKVHLRQADEEAASEAHDADGGGGAPAAVGEAAQDDAGAALRADEEAALDDAEDGDAVGLVQHPLGDAVAAALALAQPQLVGGAPELLHDLGSALALVEQALLGEWAF